jgi:hypothetical protein
VITASIATVVTMDRKVMRDASVAISLPGLAAAPSRNASEIRDWRDCRRAGSVR